MKFRKEAHDGARPLMGVIVVCEGAVFGMIGKVELVELGSVAGVEISQRSVYHSQQG